MSKICFPSLTLYELIISSKLSGVMSQEHKEMTD